ncbi:winged helix-turn-helix domain-containing protein [Metallibacterium sp.]|jgi:hypothetical protein|uniref:winged helix-turn-helix domain-containing protein n=1 Tax=Metallibacterium sp. TaxID=2940281 RepID=UPI0026114E4C|nr:winged helix-turn-helix domain-containing protein [Metallibacterium sp.]
MAPTIRIDDDVYAWLQGQAKPFDDTPNSVLRRLADLDKPSATPVVRAVRRSADNAGKTPQQAFRTPILKVLAKQGGQAARMAVLNGVEKLLANELTPYDKADIDSGTIRWQKSAEWEVRKMREEGLLKPVKDGPHGYWVLTRTGEAAARTA